MGMHVCANTFHKIYPGSFIDKCQAKSKRHKLGLNLQIVILNQQHYRYGGQGRDIQTNNEKSNFLSV